MRRRHLILIYAILVLVSLYVFEGFFRKDVVYFASPLKSKSFQVRNDRFGEGHFGAKRKNERSHQGTDLVAPIGAPVMAAKSGWAIRRYDEDGYGNYIKIYHRGGLMTIYGHLMDTEINWFKKVEQGEVIGRVGKTGNAKYAGIKPHLHFEVRKLGTPVDPFRGYLEE